MEPEAFEAFRSCRDEAIQCIDKYLKKRQELENDRELIASWNRFAVRKTPSKKRSQPTGYLHLNKPPFWNSVCNDWPRAAQEAADHLKDAKEIALAKGIYRELSKLPVVADWERLCDCFKMTTEAAKRVKAILTAIRPAVLAMPDTPNNGPWSDADFPSQWAKKFKCSWKTLKRKIDGRKIRAKVLSTKSYKIHIDDLPKDK